MILVKGKYAEAQIMCKQELIDSEVDKYAISQIQMICDNRASEGSVIRVMPDVHPGKVRISTAMWRQATNGLNAMSIC